VVHDLDLALAGFPCYERQIVLASSGSSDGVTDEKRV
jgi:hypothetical protein